MGFLREAKVEVAVINGSTFRPVLIIHDAINVFRVNSRIVFVEKSAGRGRIEALQTLTADEVQSEAHVRGPLLLSSSRRR